MPVQTEVVATAQALMTAAAAADRLDGDACACRRSGRQKSRSTAAIPAGTVITVGSVPPPPPPPGGVAADVKWAYADTDYTAPGRQPLKTKDVRPIYAPMVMASGIKGDVVLEATVDPRGKGVVGLAAAFPSGFRPHGAIHPPMRQGNRATAVPRARNRPSEAPRALVEGPASRQRHPPVVASRFS